MKKRTMTNSTGQRIQYYEAGEVEKELNSEAMRNPGGNIIPPLLLIAVGFIVGVVVGAWVA